MLVTEIDILRQFQLIFKPLLVMLYLSRTDEDKTDKRQNYTNILITVSSQMC